MPILRERLGDGLRTLDEEAMFLFAERSLLQTDRGDDLLILRRRQHDGPRTGGVYVGPDGRGYGAAGDDGLRLLDELRERAGIVDGDIRKDLAVDLDAGRMETAHESRVREPVRTNRRR